MVALVGWRGTPQKRPVFAHVRGRKTMGMSEKEISKFLASKALKDAKLLRALEVVPKKTIPYLNPCNLFGHCKKLCQQKEPRMKQLKKMKAEKAKKSKKIIEPTTKMIVKELQKNISDLCANENHLCKIGKDLGKRVMRSKGLVEIQKKLFERLFELEVERTGGLKNLCLTLSNAKNPKKVLKKLPLHAEELEQFERILAGKDELEKLDNRFTDYMIYLEQIKSRHLELHRLND
jgi:hypothetical protein